MDEEQPSDDQIMQFLEEEAASNQDLPEETQAYTDPNDGEQDSDALPTREEMWQTIQEQQSIIESQTQALYDVKDRVAELEELIEEEGDALHQASTQLEEAAEQLRSGKLSGEAGADLLANLNNYSPTKLTESRAVKLYYSLVREEKVGVRVKTSQVVRYCDLDTKNPNQTAHRVMQKLQELTEEGQLLGEVQTYLWKGERVVEMVGGDDS